MTQLPLNGKVALITGASRGIGLAIAQAYVGAGAKVVLSSRKQEGLDQAASTIREQGGEALPVAAHSSDSAAVIMLTKVLAAELAADNIQVNAIAPGFVKTKFSSVLWQTETINEAILKAIPQGRMAEPQEIAGLALYLASPSSSFTTGATFVVDGGQLVGSRVSII